MKSDSFNTWFKMEQICAGMMSTVCFMKGVITQRPISGSVMESLELLEIFLKPMSLYRYLYISFYVKVPKLKFLTSFDLWVTASFHHFCRSQVSMRSGSDVKTISYSKVKVTGATWFDNGLLARIQEFFPGGVRLCQKNSTLDLFIPTTRKV
jgi:hypothetical protein